MKDERTSHNDNDKGSLKDKQEMKDRYNREEFNNIA